MLHTVHKCTLTLLHLPLLSFFYYLRCFEDFNAQTIQHNFHKTWRDMLQYVSILIRPVNKANDLEENLMTARYHSQQPNIEY